MMMMMILNTVYVTSSASHYVLIIIYVNSVLYTSRIFLNHSSLLFNPLSSDGAYMVHKMPMIVSSPALEVLNYSPLFSLSFSF